MKGEKKQMDKLEKDKIEELFEGCYIGKKDELGKKIKCGDRIKLVIRRPEFIEPVYSIEDGWSRKHELFPPKEVKHVEEERVLYGKVEYEIKRLAFVFVFKGIHNLDVVENESIVTTELLHLFGKGLFHDKIYIEG